MYTPTKEETEALDKEINSIKDEFNEVIGKRIKSAKIQDLHTLLCAIHCALGEVGESYEEFVNRTYAKYGALGAVARRSEHIH